MDAFDPREFRPVAPPDPRQVATDRTVDGIERVVGRLDVHARIAVTRIVEDFADDIRAQAREPW